MTPRLEVSCVRGTLPLNGVTALTGALDSASGCRARDLVISQATFTQSYVLPVQAGQGYLVLMWARNNVGMHSRLELATADTSGETLLAASAVPGFGASARLLFASASSATDTIRATTADAAPSDTGSYGIVARTCSLPVPPVTDSITHRDLITGNDCQADYSALNIGDVNTANVHLYAVHFTAGATRRVISFTASAPVRVLIGGPHDDTFAVTGGTMFTTLPQADTAGTFSFSASKPGDYTLLIGPDNSAPAWTHYTLTIGREH
ncbi:MAG TPA: hypothetical protein VH137_09685 [Gemmatimonadales bacterium]|nr:hypothetical protein [Gemmatimonadales bacterium]